MAADPKDLVTLAQVKTHLGLRLDSDATDLVLQAIITSASRWLMNQLHSNIKEATYTKTFHGDGTSGLTLPDGPVAAVTEVKVDGEVVDEQLAVNEPGWVLCNGRVRLVDSLFNEGVANVEVTYRAGYATVPEDLQLACLELVGSIYRGRDRIGVLSRSVPSGESITFRAEDVPFITKLVMENYTTVLGVPR
jgi:uncharacterized phiE125 gp8 family phage protein